MKPSTLLKYSNNTQERPHPYDPWTSPRCQGIQHREIGAGDVDANGGSTDQWNLEIHGVNDLRPPESKFGIGLIWADDPKAWISMM